MTGTVQGVGFRPFVYGLAVRLGLTGLVGNDAAGVFAEVEGPPAAVDEFLATLTGSPPPLARIDEVTTIPVPPRGPGGPPGFTIVASDAAGPRTAQVSPDTAPCADCLRELADPADRRFCYPFINCTNCGPRFTIVRGVPYDRPQTTMAAFAMCERCAAEYADPADRRFHAQPVCCPDCGPRLRLCGPDGQDLPGEPIAAAAALLRGGAVLAVKGLGGFHLAVDAASEPAAAALRGRKHRAEKPFAVLVADLAAARALADLDPASEALLTSIQRPIVLADRRPGAAVASAVAPRTRQLGLLLPYTPLHHLLIRATGRPIVLTSGNSSDEPIAYRDEEMLPRLSGLADAFLTHDRPIHIRTDDSVARSAGGQAALIRRARGYAPAPLPLPVPARRPVLACGAELKSTVCLARGGSAIVSQHLGDLENFETLRSFTETIEHLGRLFGITPQVVAHDLHPGYLSTQYAAGRDGVTLLGVQHHHAHIAACLADNGERGPVIGVAFDGTGYGTDGTLWGGEFLLADLVTARRAGHLAAVPLPGGEAAIREPWRMAAVYLSRAFGGAPPPGLAVAGRNQRRWDAVLAMAGRGINAPVTSSAGRLFDAAAALLGVRDTISYEGQAAIELEQLADPGETGCYLAGLSASTASSANERSFGNMPRPTNERSFGNARKPTNERSFGDGLLIVSGADLIGAAAGDLAAGIAPGLIAARFHNGVAAAIVAVCERLRDSHGLGTVALSGGVFQNLLLTGRAVAGLTASGFRVLVHARVPCNDGGISFGQAAVAAATDAAGEEAQAAGATATAG